MDKPITPRRLKITNSKGAGLEIHAHIDRPVNCVEYTMKGNHYQMVACAPWIQFPTQKWDTMVETLFIEMVDAWNEKYSKEVV